MHFKRLEMMGFKSFADKTVLNFEPGITVIVGPNGCGKSNIFDAIRWVLGEQSVKALRGTSMEDVIFNGTSNKAGVGFAEVSLTFCNENKILPIEYDEVTVTRRLFRSGESEYLLNKTQVRLKDILELFMGTGIGAESYSLLEQGKIDLIISSKPEERRLIFDEASGITKYKSKKREALNKLQDTENNLLRINDIITEVKRQIGSIERQANKARRYKEEFEKLKDLEIKLAFFELNKLKTDRQEVFNKASGLKDKEAALKNEIEELNKKLTTYNLSLEEFEHKFYEIKSQDLAFASSMEMDGRQIGLNKERITETKERGKRSEQQKKQIDQRCLIEKERIEKLKLEVADLNKFEKDSSNLLKEKKDALEEIALTIKKAQDDIVKSKKSVLELTSNQSKIRNELTEVLTQTQTFLARKRRLEMENTKVSLEKQELDANLESVGKELQQVQSKISHLVLQKQEAVNSHSALESEFKTVKEKIIAEEKEKAHLESQKEFIEDLKLQYQEMPSAISGVLLTSQPPAANITGILGRVKQVLPMEDKFKIFLDTQVNKDLKQMKQIVCETKFIELDSLKIAQRINEIINSLEKLRAEESSLNSEIEKINKQIQDLEDQMHQEEIVSSKYQMQKNNILDEVGKLDAELELVSDELKETQGALDKLNIKDLELKRENNTLEEQFKQTQNVINSNQELVSLKIKERETTSITIAQTQTELASFKDKQASLLANLKMFEETQNRNLEELKHLEKEGQEFCLKVEDLEKHNLKLEQKINQATAKKQSLKIQFQEIDKRKTDMLNLIKTEQLKISVQQEELERIINGSHQLQMQEQEFSFKEEGLKERISQAYKVNLEELKGVSLENIDLELFNNQISQLKDKLESFGTVNLVAIEEYEELKQRFEFLNQQQADLLSAKEQIQNTITKINRTTKQLFLDTFTKVGEEFKNYFRLIFGGGEAQLTLINPEDVLETGIEIVACPPGKKLQSISLLSGGEKALTATALMFAVFKVKPSPFCILDEIDAALDESNVGRFGYLLKEFIKTSQFIVITHNKKTIVNADVMYGITMQETGISKIVSVKFSDKNKDEATVENREVVAATV